MVSPNLTGGINSYDYSDDIPRNLLGSPCMKATASGDAFVHGELEELPQQPLPLFSKEDAPFTDSGYASGINVDHLPEMELGGANTPGFGKIDMDARTVYSGTNTVAIGQAQCYIAELSSTIHRRIIGNIDVDNWKLLSERLSGRIKDFAIIKLGLEPSIQVTETSCTSEIAKQVDSLVLSVNAPIEDVDESNMAKRDHMPLRDKMAMWISQAMETKTAVNPRELFEGVADVDETIDAPELSRYNKTVAESNSFEWLIESLRRELILTRDTDESGGCNHREILRRKIIRNLPTGEISKSRPPTTHHAALIAWMATPSKRQFRQMGI
ncbi:hypothetical protein LX32DRAFT_695370 [Colletotrichum zoysiae]|uniref:Uncharacterized protein n=1 Tax=Colletotrichum zoysiae TaxID=1216348 RepID=A0AAD9LZK1_9PEZI|nr:hypothetical protein LX32DRAFT_695370 [Colletotrichum zoysiae]